MTTLQSLSRPLLPPWRIAVVVAVFLLALFFVFPHPYLDLASHGGYSGRKAYSKNYDRPLVLYAYAESENARENLEFFIKRGLHGRADFVFIFNGPTPASQLVPRSPNVRVVERDNTCFDLGAIGEVLIKDDLWKKYKKFITMNASIRGPFLPMYNEACWMDVFLDRITDYVKLVGTSMNCVPRPHVQSMLFATDDIGMSILLNPDLAHTVKQVDHWGNEDDPVGLTICFDTLFKAVHSEIAITELIRSQGYEVDVMLASFQAAKQPSTYCQENDNPDDVLYDGKYFGTTVHPYETVFMKANRGIGEATLSVLTKWHLQRPVSSWDTCKT